MILSRGGGVESGKVVNRGIPSLVGFWLDFRGSGAVKVYIQTISFYEGGAEANPTIGILSTSFREEHTPLLKTVYRHLGGVHAFSRSPLGKSPSPTHHKSPS